MDDLPYFGTRENPTNVADDDPQKLDITVRSELTGMKLYLMQMLGELKLDLKQEAAEVKIEALANEKARFIIEPIIAVIDNKLKGVKN